ncbi:DNA (cytosine-5-)-methyltransferase [Dionaea muscipula]
MWLWLMSWYPGFSRSDISLVPVLESEGHADLLLEALFTYSASQKSNSETSEEMKFNTIPTVCDAENLPDKVFQMSKSASSDSLDSLFYDGKDAEITSMSVDVLPKEEAVLLDEIDYEKRASLLMMNFPVKEVDYAIGKLGASAPINELVDFIIAFQMAENEETESPDPDHKGNNVDGNTEVLFWTMDKTLRLLELGFTEHEVSLAIEKFGKFVRQWLMLLFVW